MPWSDLKAVSSGGRSGDGGRIWGEPLLFFMPSKVTLGSCGAVSAWPRAAQHLGVWHRASPAALATSLSPVLGLEGMSCRILVFSAPDCRGEKPHWARSQNREVFRSQCPASTHYEEGSGPNWPGLPVAGPIWSPSADGGRCLLRADPRPGPERGCWREGRQRCTRTARKSGPHGRKRRHGGQRTERQRGPPWKNWSHWF